MDTSADSASRARGPICADRTSTCSPSRFIFPLSAFRPPQPPHTATQLRQAAALKEQLESLQNELATFLRAPAATPPPAAAPKPKGTISAAGIARIKAAQKARWAKIKAAKPVAKPAPAPVPAKKWKLSAAGKAKIIAASKAYWAKVKAAKKK